MRGDALVVGVLVHYAVLRSLIAGEDVFIHHTLDEPLELFGHGRRLQNLGVFTDWGVGLGLEEAVCATEMHCAAAEIRSPCAFGGVVQKE